jgi:uncharacterized protein HemY
MPGLYPGGPDDPHQEAIELLEKALKLEPEDPFILDSMGWAMFKAKRYAEAVDYLRRAFGIRPDPEIAAHFGEALWMKGDKEEARRVWRNGLSSIRTMKACAKSPRA